MDSRKSSLRVKFSDENETSYIPTDSSKVQARYIPAAHTISAKDHIAVEEHIDRPEKSPHGSTSSSLDFETENVISASSKTRARTPDAKINSDSLPESSPVAKPNLQREATAISERSFSLDVVDDVATRGALAQRAMSLDSGDQVSVKAAGAERSLKIDASEDLSHKTPAPMLSDRGASEPSVIICKRNTTPSSCRPRW